MVGVLRPEADMKPTVNVLYLPGTNCQAETLRAFRRAGARASLLFLSDVMNGNARLDSADILCIPGGFSFGDHLGAGAIAGLILRTKLADQFRNCWDRPLLGICNGFQIALRAGCFGPGIALMTNSSGTFTNRPDQRHIVSDVNESPWLTGLGSQTLEFPCAHGEGRLVYDDTGTPALWRVALHYPDDANPDGSVHNIAGLTSGNGLVFGLMDHPERADDPAIRMVFFDNGLRAATG
jgi:phosphoribosylformylglycinamidine (FGAM) synthase-like amidotransferase family enzyme